MVQVIAIDEEHISFHSTATVTINIKDTNDNSPVFPMDTYKLEVAEHVAAGTVLDTITVSPLQFEFLLRLSCMWKTLG